MERGFVISVVLILAVAMFAGNLNSDNDISGMQVSGGEDEETCEDKCAREKAQDDAACMLDFNDAKTRFKHELKGCTDGMKKVWERCNKNADTPAEIANCIRDNTANLDICKEISKENVASAENERNICLTDSKIKYDACMNKCNNGKKETKAPMQIN
jgi:hypothetical protein